MTIEEKNIEISEMIGCFVREPDKHSKNDIPVEIPDRFGFYCEGFGYSQNPKSKKKLIHFLFDKPGMRGEPINWSYSKNLQFDSNADWQDETINFVEKDLGYQVETKQNEVLILNPYKKYVVKCSDVNKTRKEIMFDALFQLSQYIKKQSENKV